MGHRLGYLLCTARSELRGVLLLCRTQVLDTLQSLTPAEVDRLEALVK